MPKGWDDFRLHGNRIVSYMLDCVTLMYSEWPKESNQAAKICVRYQSVVSNI